MRERARKGTCQNKNRRKEKLRGRHGDTDGGRRHRRTNQGNWGRQDPRIEKIRRKILSLWQSWTCTGNAHPEAWTEGHRKAVAGKTGETAKTGRDGWMQMGETRGTWHRLCVTLSHSLFTVAVVTKITQPVECKTFPAPYLVISPQDTCRFSAPQTRKILKFQKESVGEVLPEKYQLRRK